MPGGRPRKNIDQKSFEQLCGIQCTKDEICAWFDITDKTLESWCKRTYHKGFSEVFADKRGVGKISLRRMQWRLAERNANMAIHLGKQYLGQVDRVQMGMSVQVDDDPITKALKESGIIQDDGVK